MLRSLSLLAGLLVRRFHAEQLHGVAAENLIFVSIAQTAHRSYRRDGAWPGRDCVAVVEIAADDDVVIGPDFDDFRQVIFPGYGRDIKLLEVRAWLFFQAISTFEEIVHRCRSGSR